jgi:LPPG:FO 2-phospho-L-lactate transferase
MEMWGLHVSPDIDTILYALSGRLDTERGWGLAEETFRCREAIEAFDMPTWFPLGDVALATHLARTQMLRNGLKLDQTVERLARSMQVKAHVLPATNDPVRTRIEIPGRLLGFQEYFEREHWKPDVRSVIYSGAAEARATDAVLQSIREAEMVILAPGSPITSIGPILAVPGIRDALRCTRAEVVAISPLIRNAAISGPAAKLMEACGYDVSPSGVARCYHDFLDNIVIDTSDAALAPSIRYETIGVHVTNILISDIDRARQLAEFVLTIN